MARCGGMGSSTTPRMSNPPRQAGQHDLQACLLLMHDIIRPAPFSWTRWCAIPRGAVRRRGWCGVGADGFQSAPARCGSSSRYSRRMETRCSGPDQRRRSRRGWREPPVFVRSTVQAPVVAKASPSGRGLSSDGHFGTVGEAGRTGAALHVSARGTQPSIFSAGSCQGVALSAARGLGGGTDRRRAAEGLAWTLVDLHRDLRDARDGVDAEPRCPSGNRRAVARSCSSFCRTCHGQCASQKNTPVPIARR